QHSRVFGDAVVSQGERAAAIGVRVRVDGVGGAVRGPARVGDAGVAAGERLAELFFEHADLAGRLVHLDPAVGDERDPRRVVAAILEPLQTLEQQGRRLPGTGVPYDAAHRGEE